MISTQLLNLTGNEDLQWTEGSYRGFFTIAVEAETLSATYYAMTDVGASSVIRRPSSVLFCFQFLRRIVFRWSCELMLYLPISPSYRKSGIVR